MPIFNHYFQPIADRYGSKCTFTCNCCGTTVQNADIGSFDTADIEHRNCPTCQSSVRNRSIVHLLSLALFGASVTIPDMPERKDIVGVGLTDEDCYAIPLADKFSFENTFYHKPPVLDIMQDVSSRERTADFVISSDVFEHVLPPVQVAFDNTYRILKPGGRLVFSVPFRMEEDLQEHYPNTVQIHTIERKGEWLLISRNHDGSLSLYDNVRFHGGPGATVEMRCFNRRQIVRCLEQSGFTEIEFLPKDVPAFGIFNPYPWSRPLIAKKPI